MSKLNEHWVLVPAAPTTSQIINGSLATAFVTHKGAVAVYRAMLSAAPPPPSEEAAKAEPAPDVLGDETAEGISSALVELRAVTEDPKYTSNIVSKYDRQCIEAAIGILSALEPVPAQEPHPIHASDCALHNGPATDPGPCDCGADPDMTPERYGSERPAQEQRGCPTPGAWERQAKGATSVIRMIRAMIGEMFGTTANMESEEATLLRGPEAKHDGEAILEALGRVRDALHACSCGQPADEEPVGYMGHDEYGEAYAFIGPAPADENSIPLYARPSGAFERGARAMREACFKAVEDCGLMAERFALVISALPLPEDKEG